MKYLVTKKKKDNADAILMDTPRVIIADDENSAIKKYKAKSGDVSSDEDIIVLPVTNGVVNIQLPVDSFRVQYPKTAKGIVIKDTQTNTSYVGVLVATIPMGAKPSESDILEFYYRGNIEKYERDIRDAQDNEEMRLQLRRIRQPIPCDRLVVDTGTKNIIFPIQDRYVIEKN